VAWVGFAVAVAASAILAPARIAAASGLAFLLSQMLDIAVFDRLRQSRWWRAPLIATVLAAVLDTGVFWGVGFAGEDLPWVTWALGDLGVKLVMAVCLLLPFRTGPRRQPGQTHAVDVGQIQGQGAVAGEGAAAARSGGGTCTGI
jgi:uncharacterized integral membrane protein (TIGR00697 family)